MSDYTLCIAPMMEWTDRHFRYLARLMSNHIRLYTEMITSGAIVYGDKQRFLQFNEIEHPVALQLGGSDPKEMALAAQAGTDAGYDEININVGCPSDRVQSGKFGVCLMREAQLVANCINEMQLKTDLPITVKCRIGVDNDDHYEFLLEFIETTQHAGCNTFIIHARKAWLQGLSPKQNREIPELDYEKVYRLKQDHPELHIIINGGIDSVEQIQHHLNNVDGVMLGRHAYKHPHFLIDVDRVIFNEVDKSATCLEDIVLKYAKYVESNLQKGVPLNQMTKHILNLYQNIPGAKQWRRYLSENTHKPDADVTTIYRALDKVNQRCA